MQLHYHRSGQGRPLVMLHGLFGTWENLGTAVRSLSERWDVIAPDLRNHGRSPHSEKHSYPLMAEDLSELLDQLKLDQVAILGHSMGGKVAMEFALTYPERVNQLIVVDIAPVTYEHHHKTVFDGLNAVKLETLSNRRDAETQLAAHIESPSVRAFLLKNLYREGERFRWRANLKALESEYAHLAEAPRSGHYEKPVLFIKGADSDYLQSKHQPDVVARFPNAELKIISGAGHWPHAEKPELFLKLVNNFLNR